MKTKKILLSSILTLALCLSLICGATFALFTSTSTANIAVSSGKVNMTAEIENVKLSYQKPNTDNTAYETVEGKLFAGNATVEGNKISLEKLVPGDKITLDIVVYNESNVASKYQTLVGISSDNGLFDGLAVTLDNVTYTGATAKSEWIDAVAVAEKTKIQTVAVSIELPIDVGNEYQDKSCELYLTVNAVQGNALCTNPVENTVELYTARDLLQFAKEVNDGNTFAGKTVKLMDDVDLAGIEWKPVGQTQVSSFQGTFDGQGHTIKNMTVNYTGTNSNYACGLFGWIELHNGAPIVIQNVKFDNANVTGIKYTGVVAGYANGASGAEIKNCVVTNSTVTSNSKNAGGIIGYMGKGVLTGNTVSGCTISAKYDVGGIANSVEPAVTFTKNKVENTKIYYEEDQSYDAAGIFTGGKVVYRYDNNKTTFVPDSTNTNSNVTVNKLVAITTAEDLVAFAKDVNENGNSYAGKTVMLMNDIDLADIEWKPVGQTTGYSAATYFQGTFDGNGKTISNLTIGESSWEEGSNDGQNFATGFFGFIDVGSTTIKNVTFDNANVEGHHWVGVVAGYMTGTVSDVTVTNSTVTSSYKTSVADGDKAGVIVGYINAGTVKNCTATKCTVTAGRDAGQIVGAAKTEQVTGCSATDVTVTATGDCTGANVRNEVIGRVL